MPEHEDAARRAVRDELARRRQDPAWLARTALLDPGTVDDFLDGRRWPRLKTLAKVESALEWAPGTIDTVAREGKAPRRGSALYDIADAVDRDLTVDQMLAMRVVIWRQLQAATQDWAEAVYAAQQSRARAEAADVHRHKLESDLAALNDQLREHGVADTPIPSSAPGLPMPGSDELAGRTPIDSIDDDERARFELAARPTPDAGSRKEQLGREQDAAAEAPDTEGPSGGA